MTTTETLPSLSGTEKQNAWASDLRARALADIADHVARYSSGPSVAMANGTTDEMRRRLILITDATVWINNRSSLDRIADSLARGRISPRWDFLPA